MVNAPVRLMWIDTSAGVAGDMLLGALVDVGAPLETCQAAVDSVIPGTVRLVPSLVTRAGLRAAAVRVEPLADDLPHRSWATIRALLADASLPEAVRDRALSAFGALARAEAHVHGLHEDDVHFHEVGSWDSIADVVAVSAAVDALAAEVVKSSETWPCSGSVRV